MNKEFLFAVTKVYDESVINSIKPKTYESMNHAICSKVIPFFLKSYNIQILTYFKLTFMEETEGVITSVITN